MRVTIEKSYLSEGTRDESLLSRISSKGYLLILGSVVIGFATMPTFFLTGRAG